MRQLIPNVTLVYLLSAFILGSNGRVTPCVPARYGDNETIDYEVVCVKDPIEAIERRAGGGRGGGRNGDEDSPDSPGGGRPGDGNGPGGQGPADSSGDTTGQGGMGRTGGTEGGMGCKKRSWITRWIPWRRCNTGQPPPPPPLNIDSIKTRMGNVLNEKRMENSGNWVFWSGFDRTPAFDEWTKNVQGKMLADTWRDEPQKQAEMGPYQAAGETWKFWSYNSKAFGQFVKGDVYVAVPSGRPLNKPYANGKGSNFWTFELPELVRRPGEVGQIRLVQVLMNEDGTPSPKMQDFDNSRAIWSAKWSTDWAGPDEYNTPGDPDIPPTQPTSDDWKQPSP